MLLVLERIVYQSCGLFITSATTMYVTCQTINSYKKKCESPCVIIGVSPVFSSMFPLEHRMPGGRTGLSGLPKDGTPNIPH